MYSRTPFVCVIWGISPTSNRSTTPRATDGGQKEAGTCCQGLATAPLVSWKVWVTSYLIKVDCRCLGVPRKMRGKELSFMRWREDLGGSGALDRPHRFWYLGCREQKCNLNQHNWRRDKLVKREKKIEWPNWKAGALELDTHCPATEECLPTEHGLSLLSQVLQLGCKWTLKVLLVVETAGTSRGGLVLLFQAAKFQRKGSDRSKLGQ